MTTPRSRVAGALLWTVLWCVLVIDVQPWVARTGGPQGTTDSANNLVKGVVLGIVLMVAVLSTRAGFRTRIAASTWAYLGYALFLGATAVLLLDPASPMLRVLRLLTALFLMVLVWQPLIRVPERLVTAHLAGHVVLLATVLVGPVLWPGEAWRAVTTVGGGNRLQGVLLPMVPPRVGEIGAIVCGLAVVTLLARRIRPLPGSALVVAGLALVALSRTRTAAAALVAGLALALLLTRKTWAGRLATLGLPAAVAAAFLTVPALHGWLLRGQSPERLATLSGRTRTWNHILAEEVTAKTALIGHGLGNKAVLLRRGEGDIDVQPIDNSWLGLYWEAGLIGLAVVTLAFVLAWLAVLRAPTPYVRACGAMLIGYVTVASINENGLSDLSSMSLHLLVAAAIADADRLRHRRQSYSVRHAGAGGAQPVPVGAAER